MLVDTLGHNALRVVNPLGQSMHSYGLAKRFRGGLVGIYDPIPYNGSLGCFPNRITLGRACGEKVKPI